MENTSFNLEILSSEQLLEINGGGLYDQLIKVGASFLVAWHGFIEKQQQSGSSGMEFMGGA